MLQDAIYIIRKFNRISHNSQKFQYFELDNTNLNLIAFQWNEILTKDINDEKSYCNDKNIDYDEMNVEFSIPHFESLYSCLLMDIDYHRRNPDEAWIVPHIGEMLTGFLTMACIGKEFYGNEKFQKLYPMLHHRL